MKYSDLLGIFVSSYLMKDRIFRTVTAIETASISELFRPPKA